MNFKALILSACLLGLGSCASSGPGSPPEELWREVEVAAPSSRLLFKVALSELSQRGYPINNQLNPGKGLVSTGWKTRLQPFSKAGWRERISLTIEARGERRWLVRAHAQRQMNMAVVNPLDATRAEWKWSPDNPVAAEIVLQSILSTMDTPIEIGSNPH